MVRKTTKKGSLENPVQNRDIPPSAGLLEKLAIESAEDLIHRPDNAATHGNLVRAIQTVLEKNGVDENERLKYFDLIEGKVTDFVLDPEKLRAAKARPQHQPDLFPEAGSREELKLKAAPDGKIEISYQGYQYFAKIKEVDGEKIIVIKKGDNAIDLTRKQYDFLRSKAHAMFPQIEKSQRKKFDPRQKTFL